MGPSTAKPRHLKMWYPGNCCRRWTSSFYAVSWWSPIISDFWVWLGRKKTPQHSEAHCTFTDFPPYLHVLNISSISSIPSFLNVALQEVSSFLSLWTESVKGGTLALQALSFKGWSDRIFILIYIYIYYIYIHWLVVWNMAFMTFPSYWECHHPNWLSLHHFSEG